MTNNSFRKAISRTKKLFKGKELLFRIRNEVKRGIKDNICFVHAHKCGGTSINAAIKNHLIMWDKTTDKDIVTLDSEASTKVLASDSDSQDIYQLREKLLLYFMGTKNNRFISGHFLFSESAYQEFKNEYKFIVMLRHPVKRWISHYFYNRYKDIEFGKIDDDIKACINSDFGIHNGTEYIRFIGGFSESGDYTSKESINNAKNNLSKFDLIGFLEHQDFFVKQFKEIFNINLKLRKTNTNPKSTQFRRKIITKDIENEISSLCQPDIELYNYALESVLNIPSH